MRLARTFVALALGLALGTACGPSPERLEAAQQRAEAYFEHHVDTVDPGWANLFGYLHRRFGLELQNAAGASLHQVPLEQARPEVAAVYRRLVDPNAAVGAHRIAGLESSTDRMTALALHCGHLGLPPDWPGVLHRAADAGGYALTHAALASEWTLESGCRTADGLSAVRRHIVERLVELAEARGALDPGFRAPTDVFLEAIAMLYYLGAGERVKRAWLETILETQRPDGGWGLHPGASISDPHATALALWALLENLRPDAPRIRWVP